MKITSILSMIDVTAPIVGAEIGVWDGSLSKYLLDNQPNLILHMVDLWQPWTPKDKTYIADDDIMCSTSADRFEQIYQDVIKLVEPFGLRAVINRDDSVQAAATYDDDYFDFVFVDAEHSEAALALDIAAWWPKVRPGGWLGGHDYEHPDFPGVTKAVNTFAENINAAIEVVDYSCWFIGKKR